MPEPLFDADAFDDYIKAFNGDDFEGYGRYYASTIHMNYNGRVTLEGREMVRQFYARMHTRLRQAIKILHVAATSEVLFADIEGTFLALEDCPDFSLGPLAKGECLLSRSLARYDLDGARITSVTTARYALELPQASRKDRLP